MVVHTALCRAAYAAAAILARRHTTREHRLLPTSIGRGSGCASWTEKEGCSWSFTPHSAGLPTRPRRFSLAGTPLGSTGCSQRRSEEDRDARAGLRRKAAHGRPPRTLPGCLRGRGDSRSPAHHLGAPAPTN